MTTKGLGRGLSALFSDTEEAYENAQGESASGVRELPLSDIYPNPDQPRKIFDEGALNDLASSIRERSEERTASSAPSSSMRTPTAAT